MVGGVLREWGESGRFEVHEEREEEDRLAQEKDVADSEAYEEQEEEEEEEIEDAIEDVVAVVNVKKNAQKMKEYNLNNNASGKKGDESNSAKSVRFEALKKLNVTTQKRKKNRAYTRYG